MKKKNSINITEAELQKMIIEAIQQKMQEIAVKKKNPYYYWTKKATCPECGKKEGDSMHGGLCPNCAKAKNKAQSMRGFNEGKLHKIVIENIQKMM